MPRETSTRGPSNRDQQIRDDEVRRAMKELAAFFTGGRTEREARSALKIIKRFIRDRERTPPAKRAPLPSLRATRRAGAPAVRAKAERRRKRVRKAKPAVQQPAAASGGDDAGS
jgi:hypothetical protein